jgi:hypothetical protein
MIEGIGEIVIRRPAATSIEFVTDLERYKQADWKIGRALGSRLYVPCSSPRPSRLRAWSTSLAGASRAGRSKHGAAREALAGVGHDRCCGAGTHGGVGVPLAIAAKLCAAITRGGLPAADPSSQRRSRSLPGD